MRIVLEPREALLKRLAKKYFSNYICKFLFDMFSSVKWLQLFVKYIESAVNFFQIFDAKPQWFFHVTAGKRFWNKF